MLLFFRALSCHKSPDTPANPKTSSDFGIVYYQNNGNVCALDIDKGQRLWQTALTYADDRNGMVYDSSILYSGNIYGMAAIDAKTGSLIWNTHLNTFGFQFGSPAAIEDRPVVSDSSVYIVSVSPDPTVADHPTLCCLNKKTGAIRWTKDLVAGSYSTSPVYSTPVVVNNKIIAIGHCSSPITLPNTIYCFEKSTGKQIWNNNSLFSNSLHYINSYPFSPDSSQIIFISDHSELVSLDINTGAVLWTSTFPISSPRNVTPILGNGQLYLYDGYNFMNFNLTTRQAENVINDTVSTETISGNNAYTVTFKNFPTKIDHIVAARPINNYSNPTWKWVSPTKILFDSVLLDPANNSAWFDFSYYSNLTTDGKVVYYYENFYDEFIYAVPPSLQLNALFMLDANTGSLLKELKLSYRPLGDSLLGKHLIVVKNNKAYYPF